jgi:hypothetical protein
MEMKNELLEKILSLQAENKIAFMTIDGLQGGPIEDFVKQPIEGQLYDLNRDRATLYSMANENKNKRWINDLAFVYLYEYVNEIIENQRQEIVNLKGELGVKTRELDEAKQQLLGIKKEKEIYKIVPEITAEITSEVKSQSHNETPANKQSIFQPVLGTISI